MTDYWPEVTPENHAHHDISWLSRFLLSGFVHGGYSRYTCARVIGKALFDPLEKRI